MISGGRQVALLPAPMNGIPRPSEPTTKHDHVDPPYATAVYHTPAHRKRTHFRLARHEEHTLSAGALLESALLCSGSRSDRALSTPEADSAQRHDTRRVYSTTVSLRESRFLPTRRPCGTAAAGKWAGIDRTLRKSTTSRIPPVNGFYFFFSSPSCHHLLRASPLAAREDFRA